MYRSCMYANACSCSTLCAIRCHSLARSGAYRKRERMMITRRTIAKSLAATPLVALTLELREHWTYRTLAQGAPVRIGSKDFTEQLILGEMYALLLENAGITVERHLNLGGTRGGPGGSGRRRDRSLSGVHRHRADRGSRHADRIGDLGDTGERHSDDREARNRLPSGLQHRRRRIQEAIRPLWLDHPPSTTRRRWPSSAPLPRRRASRPSAIWPRSPVI